MSWDEEKEHYAKKVKNLINGITAIRSIEGNRLIDEDMSKSLNKILDNARILLPKLSEGVFEIAVVGLEKAGKSSFSNAITGLNILPTDDKRCTYTSTCIRPGDVAHAIVKFYDQRDFERNFAEKLIEIGIPDADKYNLRNLTLSKYEQLFENCDPVKKRLYADSLHQDIRNTLMYWPELQTYIGRKDREFSAEELATDDFAQYISNPARAIAVRDVILYSPELKAMPNAVLYDVPGFDSPTAMHREQTLQKMRDADAIIMVASAAEPSIKGTELGIFRENVDEYGCQLDEKLFVFGNKADAVTSREQLQKNIAEIKKDWIEIRKILPARFAGRITCGSARAHLGEKVEKGIEARKTLADYGQTDGIGDQREKLIEYYQKDRFDVLKKRVTALLQDVQSVFAGVDCDVTDTSALDYTATSKLVANTCREITRSLADELIRIRSDLQKQQSLKAEIGNQIGKVISLEKYQLRDDEIEEEKRNLLVTQGADMPKSVDGALRKKRFYAMQQCFTEEIIGCAVERHNAIASQILDAFMAAMNVAPTREEYEELRADAARYCGLDKEESAVYYQSLIERFARDLFEVQILTSPGLERRKKFIDQAANFISIGVFYRQEDESGDDAAPQNPFTSRLWRLILYPEIVRKSEGETSVNSQDIFNLVKRLTNLKFLEAGLESLILLIIKKRGNMAAAAIEAALQGLRKGLPERMVTQKAKELLQPLAAAQGADVSLEDILTSSRYLDDRHQRELNYDYEQVKSDFADDVLALRESLLNAFVPAVDLDKAFIAKESTYIEKIKEELPEEKFTDFISDHLAVIKRDELEKISGDRAQKELDRAVMREIRAILSGVMLSADAG